MVPIVVYNSLGQEREYVAKVLINSKQIALKNSKNENVRENNFTTIIIIYSDEISWHPLREKAEN